MEATTHLKGLWVETAWILERRDVDLRSRIPSLLLPLVGALSLEDAPLRDRDKKVQRVVSRIAAAAAEEEEEEVQEDEEGWEGEGETE